jgi:hypothetical protein
VRHYRLKLHGEPDFAERWSWVAARYQPLLDRREVQIDPAEVLHLRTEHSVRLILVDVRSERDYNLFHLEGAVRLGLEEIADWTDWPELPDNAVVVAMSNDEAAATEAWKRLKVLGVVNAYILEGGINRWLDLFGHLGGHERCVPPDRRPGDDRLQHRFPLALGARHAAAHPDPELAEEMSYTRKVKLARKARKSGGCG